MNALSRIKSKGFEIILIGDGFEVTPASKLTPDQRYFLKSHKAEIITELKTKTAITRWLDSIDAGEQDRREVFEQCAMDDKALKYFLWRSLEVKP